MLPLDNAVPVVLLVLHEPAATWSVSLLEPPHPRKQHPAEPRLKVNANRPPPTLDPILTRIASPPWLLNRFPGNLVQALLELLSPSIPFPLVLLEIPVPLPKAKLPSPLAALAFPSLLKLHLVTGLELLLLGAIGLALPPPLNVPRTVPHLALAIGRTALRCPPSELKPILEVKF